MSTLKANRDSQLVEKQLANEHHMKEPQLIKYLNKVHDLSEHFKTFEIMHVPREYNFHVKHLSKLDSSKKPGFNHISIQETLVILSIEEGEAKSIDISLTSSWMTPIIHYLHSGKLPYLEAKQHCKHVVKYILMSRKLYKMGRAISILKFMGNTKSP